MAPHSMTAALASSQGEIPHHLCRIRRLEAGKTDSFLDGMPGKVDGGLCTV